MGDAETGDLREDDGWARTALDRRLFGGHSSILPFLIDYLGWRPTGRPKRWRHGDGRGRPRRRNPVQGKMAAAVRDLQNGEASAARDVEEGGRWRFEEEGAGRRRGSHAMGRSRGDGVLASMGRSRRRRFPRIDGEELPEAMSRETGGECTSIGRSSGGWTGEARCGGGMSAAGETSSAGCFRCSQAAPLCCCEKGWRTEMNRGSGGTGAEGSDLMEGRRAWTSPRQPSHGDGAAMQDPSGTPARGPAHPPVDLIQSVKRPR
jgi:hypothetical protein